MTAVERSVPATADAPLDESIRMWSLVALVLYLINGLAFAAFSAVGGIWFTVSDAFGLLLAGSLIVLVVRFDDYFRPSVDGRSRTARWIGVVGMGVAMAGSIVLLSSQAGHDFVPAGGGLGMQFLGWGLLGIWFVMLAGFARQTESFSRRWRLAALIAGYGSIVAMVFTIPLGPESAIVSTGFAVTFVAIIFWVVWTRQELRG